MVGTGWREITSGLRASQEFDFQGGYMAFAVTDAMRGPQWQIETEIDGAFYRVDAGNVHSSTPVRKSFYPAGKYRLNCTQSTGFDTVKTWWAYCPVNFTDALL